MATARPIRARPPATQLVTSRPNRATATPPRPTQVAPAWPESPPDRSRTAPPPAEPAGSAPGSAASPPPAPPRSLRRRRRSALFLFSPLHQNRGVPCRTNHQNSVGLVGWSRDLPAFCPGPTVAFPSTVRLRPFLFCLGFAFGLGTGCNSSLNGTTGGKACSGDTECGAGQYCLGFSQVCPTANSAYTVGQGTCHRDCSSGACACIDRTDCRAFEDCYSGRCVAVPVFCPAEPSVCPPGCTIAPASDRPCGPVCQCEVCPTADAGIPACRWSASLNDAGPGACHAARALITCEGPSGGCGCMSDDAMTCSGPTPCGLSYGYSTCQDQCAAGEYAVACGGPPQPDASFVDQQPPSGCRSLSPTPSGVVSYCCPCESP